MSTNTGTPGRTIASNGYVLLRMPGHPLADVRGYVYEHRLVASESLGRLVTSSEQVHHRNGIKTDNRPDNLEVVTFEEHRARHRRRRDLRRPGEPNPEVTCACGCGAPFAKFDRGGRPRRFVSGHNVGRDNAGRFAVGTTAEALGLPAEERPS